MPTCYQDLSSSEYLMLGHPDAKLYSHKDAQARLLQFYDKSVKKAKALGVDVEVRTFTEAYLPSSSFVVGRPWRLLDLPVFEEDRFLSRWYFSRMDHDQML